jgi:hypothetical protein
MPKTDWSRPLSHPVIVREYKTLKTLDDVRQFLSVLPSEHRAKRTWHSVGGELRAASKGGDIAGATLALEIVLVLEGVLQRPTGAS